MCTETIVFFIFIYLQETFEQAPMQFVAVKSPANCMLRYPFPTKKLFAVRTCWIVCTIMIMLIVGQLH